MKKIKKLYQNQNYFFYLFSFYFLLLSPSPVFASVLDGRQGDKQTSQTRETGGDSQAGKQISTPLLEVSFIDHVTTFSPLLISQNSPSSGEPNSVFQQDPTTEFQQNPNSPLQQQPTSTDNSSINTPTPATPGQSKVTLEITPVGDPRVQADGRSTIKLQGRIIDEKGEVIRKDAIATLTTSAGKFIGADQDKDQGGFQVRVIDGEFTATLQSDIKPQQIRIRAAIDKIQKQSLNVPTQLGDIKNPTFPQQTDNSWIEKITTAPLEAYTQVEFSTHLRPSLVTGVLNLRIGPGGTNYWGSLQEFLDPDEIDKGTTVDFYGAAFATGKIGDWLFTGAFNSDRAINQDCEGNNRLFGGVQFCEQPYPVYGDSSTATPTTPSIDSFYARLERTPSIVGAEPDYFMWGDYTTKEFARASQLYTATSRQLHGFKANYNLGNLQITGLYANNIEGFQRDTIVPDGTSGYYFLSKRLLVPGSEIVYVEAEEINRPGTVVERKQMVRGADYEIDYDRGTLRFNRPVFATELNPFGSTLVRRIVVTYQNEGGEDSSLVGGRLQYNFSNDFTNKTFGAISYLREDQGDQDFELFGGDFLISLGNAGKIVGEFAHSNNNLITGEQASGNAYRLEAFGNITENLFAQAYYRAVEPNFSNNATFSFTPGQTRYGASLLTRLSDLTSLRVAYDVEENYGTAPTSITNFFDLFDPQPQNRPGERVSNELRTFRAGILQKLGNSDLSLEYVNRSRNDRIGDDLDGDASQIVSRLKFPLTDTLTFQAQNELNLGDSDPLYPNRTTLGLDWKAAEGVTFRLAHQFYDDSELLPGNSLTTLDTIVDQKLSDDTSLLGRYSVLSGFGGLQGQGALGVNHGWKVAPGFKVNLGYQYVFKNIFNATAAGDRYPQYYAVGQTAASLGLFSGSVYSLGFEYTDNPDFKARAQFEYRDGDQSNNLVISAAAAGKISPALTALVRFQQAGEANVYLPTVVNSIDTGGIRFQELGDTANLKIGLAYRDPTNDKFNGLLKYEWRQNSASIPETQLTGSTATGHVFSAEGIYAPNWRWEFYGKYAFRNGVTYYDNDRYDGSVNLAQLRAAYRLGYRSDLAVEGRWIGQNSNSGTDYDEFGVAVETGYYVTPDLRLGLGYSFGSVDDRDFTGYRSEGGFYVNISLKLNELLGGFGLQEPVPKQQQESEISTAQTKPAKETSQTKLIQRLKQRQKAEG
ncbi:hypothetical protein CBP28_13365 [Fischerella thermalis WC559]|uniref:hypothetical protein n=1 Tax=Fischerella thermalis TaxID=372787 RepID=UPI000C80C963|nr:hypothetical protein [Fischerella thermalis]PLZ27091.1 hypothetical protein CBP28_13365 [Fischerella thermalis WC559]PLZ29541.1 hypothetical protein CBP10_15140 [Fischerella thermalis WC558]PLZ51006.1 hypothetical protein CBP24_21945 [Fischerella thermalis WC439]PLZ61907.1 hypothetical protein CBP23_11875 [Fischerella thermalis WC344]